jgi:hypothetical protein
MVLSESSWHDTTISMWRISLDSMTIDERFGARHVLQYIKREEAFKKGFNVCNLRKSCIYMSKNQLAPFISTEISLFIM